MSGFVHRDGSLAVESEVRVGGRRSFADRRHHADHRADRERGPAREDRCPRRGLERSDRSRGCRRPSGKSAEGGGAFVVPTGGATNFARLLRVFGPSGRDVRLLGLYDSPVEDRMRHSLDRAGIGRGDRPTSLASVGFYGCVTDLEEEMIRALGPLRVEGIVGAEGELGSFRRLQAMPFHRQRPLDEQLHRFMGSRSGRKYRRAGGGARRHRSARTSRGPARRSVTAERRRQRSAQRAAGSNSSTTLPDGSSSRICLPPGPVTMSFRKVAPASRRRATSSSMSSTTKWIRFQPPGSGTRRRASAVRRALRPGQEQAQLAPLDVGEGGRRRGQQFEAERAGVEGDRLVDVVDHVTDVDQFIVGHGVTSLSIPRPVESAGTGFGSPVLLPLLRTLYTCALVRAGERRIGHAPVDEVGVGWELRTDLADAIAQRDDGIEPLRHELREVLGAVAADVDPRVRITRTAFGAAAWGCSADAASTAPSDICTSRPPPSVSGRCCPCTGRAPASDDGPIQGRERPWGGAGTSRSAGWSDAPLTCSSSPHPPDRRRSSGHVDPRSCGGCARCQRAELGQVVRDQVLPRVEPLGQLAHRGRCAPTPAAVASAPDARRAAGTGGSSTPGAVTVAATSPAVPRLGPIDQLRLMHWRSRIA